MGRTWWHPFCRRQMDWHSAIRDLFKRPEKRHVPSVETVLSQTVLWECLESQFTLISDIVEIVYIHLYIWYINFNHIRTLTKILVGKYFKMSLWQVAFCIKGVRTKSALAKWSVLSWVLPSESSECYHRLWVFISESFLRKHIWTSNFPMPFWSGKNFASLFLLKATKATLCSAKNACPWPTFAASSPSHLYSCGTRRGSTALHGTRLRPPPWRAAAVVGRGNCPGGRQRGPRAAQCQRHGDPEARDASQALWICMPGEWDAGGEQKKMMMMMGKNGVQFFVCCF